MRTKIHSNTMFANQFEIKTDAVNERILILSNL